MASPNWAEADRVALYAALQSHPYRFSFYQALRRLEAAFPARPRLGRALRAGDEPIRLGQDPSLTFAPATISSFVASSNGGPPRLAVAFGGLFGPNGPLPLHLTEYARDRLRNAQDPTFARFLDIFHHRLLALYYRAWADSQPTVHFDRPESDRFTAYVGALIGVGQPSLRERDAMPDLAKLYFAGRLACHVRNAEGLQAMLAAFFDLPMQLVEFVGHWLPLPDDCKCVLGTDGAITHLAPQDETPHRSRLAPRDVPAERADHGALAQLGVSATIGDRVWECQTKFRIVAGPMSLADYRRLLPGGASLERLMAIVKNYADLALDWDLHLVLKRAEVPAAQLGSFGQLGWTTWLVSRPPERDADDLVLQPRAA